MPTSVPTATATQPPTATPTQEASPTPTSSPPLPDLTIAALSIAPETGSICDSPSPVLGLRIWVVNNGSADAGAFLVDANGSHRLSLPGLKPGQSLTAWMPQYASTGNNYAIADPINSVDESNEANNAMTALLPIPDIASTCTPTPTPIPPATPTAMPSPTPTAKANPTVTSAPTRTPTLTTSPTPTGPDLKIAHVFHDGVYSSQEPDEYVEIINLGNLPASLDGWTLSDIDDGTPVFVFTTGFVAPGGVIRVYTNQIHPEWGGYSFGRGTAIWNNCDPDTAGLADPDGVVVSTKTYSSEC